MQLSRKTIADGMYYMLEDRLARERDFHDARFAKAAGVRPANAFYAITGASQHKYKALVQQYAMGANVLEYGCGNSPFSIQIQLSSVAKSVSGIDLSAVAINDARNRAQQANVDAARFRVANAENTGFDSGSFDVIFGSGILHHLDLEKSYREIARLLAPGGVAIFQEPLGHNLAINAYRRRTPDQRTPDEHPLLMRDLARARAFFEEVETSFFHLGTLAAIPLRSTRGFGSAVRILDAVDRFTFRMVPYLRRYAWFTVMQMHVHP